MMDSNFFALISRMRYIARWGLMRNALPENIQEHSHMVAVLAHALGVIRRDIFRKPCDVNALATAALYHDASEIITGDMPTPIKYYNNRMKDLFHSIEDEACEKLIGQLPEDLQTYYRDYFFKQGDDTEETKYLWKLVKAADKLSALIKCMEEEKTGNREFVKAKESTEQMVQELSKSYPEVKDFVQEFLPAYAKTLDELN